jgi:class 3 adenylate cyclase
VTLDETGATTLTFLFSDIEGSTALVRKLRDDYGNVMNDHKRLLRTAWEDCGGRELDSDGDSFFVAFRRPRQAVDAAAQPSARSPLTSGRRVPRCASASASTRARRHRRETTTSGSPSTGPPASATPATAGRC